MPDFNTAGDLFRSRILGMGLEDTPMQQGQIGGMMGGMQPQQLAAFFQSPEVQKQFQNFGIDPQAILHGVRQSPFFSNMFMQQHPHMGGALSGAMANVAATPEAPLVSGAGSGMSRAMQGMMGGPELTRQYQMKQMMGPMGAMAGMMPTYGEERRRAIEEAIVKETQERMKMLPGQQQMQGDLADIKRMKSQADLEKAERPETRFGPAGTGQDVISRVDAQPAGGPQGLDLQQTGQRPPVMSLSPGMQGQQMPMSGYGLSPEQQAGWNVQYKPYDQSDIEGQARAKAAGGQTPEKADELKARAERERAQGDAARNKASGGKGQGWTEKGAAGLEEKKASAIQRLESQFSGTLSKYGKRDDKGNVSLDEEAWKKADPGTYANYYQQRQEIEDQYTEAGRALGGTYPGYEYSDRGQRSTVKQNPFLSPGAGGSAAPPQASQANPAQGQQPQASGLPPGYAFNEQGIPVKQAPAPQR